MKRILFTALIGAMLGLSALPAAAQESGSSSGERPSDDVGSTEPGVISSPDLVYIGQVVLVVDGKEVEQAPAGSTVTAKVTLGNSGEKAVHSVTMTVVDPGGFVTVIDGSAGFGTIEPGAQVTRSYSFAIAEKDCQQFTGMEAKIATDEGDTVTKFGFGVSCPGPLLYFAGVRYEGGDGDQVPEPGERLKAFVTLTNTGRDPATDVKATMTRTAGDATVIDGSATWPDIAPNKSAESTAFVFEVADDAKVQDGCPPMAVDGGPAIIEPAPADQPISSEPNEGEVTTLPAEETQVDGSSGGGTDGSGGSTGTDDGNTGSGTIEPDGTVTAEPAPPPRGIEPDPSVSEPAPQDQAVAVELSVKGTAGAYDFDASFGTGFMCAYAEGRPAKGAPDSGGTDDGGEAVAAPSAARDLQRTGSAAQSNGGSGALAGVVLAMVAALALRYRFSV